MKKDLEKKIVAQIDKLDIPFCGQYIQDLENRKKYYVSRYANISVSGIGPVFYADKNNGKIYTILIRRFKDNYQWWFPGGYVELPPSGVTNQICYDDEIVEFPSLQQLKSATINKFYEKCAKRNWQKAHIELNNPKILQKNFAEQGIKWPEQIDFNWCEAWKREVAEESGTNIDEFSENLVFNFKLNQTFMLGAEKDRLTNIDGRFCAFLGFLDKMPLTKTDQEIEESKWICLDEIYYDDTTNQYIAFDKIVNHYTASLIEEGLGEITNHFIRQKTIVENKFSGQKISLFRDAQNIQSYILQKAKNFDISSLILIKKILEWKFGELGIAKNLCESDGIEFFYIFLKSSEFLHNNKLESEQDFADFNKFLQK